jgi:hypothetical protein
MKTKIFLTLILVFIIVSLLNMPSCEPSPQITFDNQQNQEIIVYAAHVRDDGTTSDFTKQGFVPAHSNKIIRITFLGDEWVNRIEARNALGDTVFSRDYDMNDLKEMGWKIVIADD